MSLRKLVNDLSVSDKNPRGARSDPKRIENWNSERGPAPTRKVESDMIELELVDVVRSRVRERLNAVAASSMYDLRPLTTEDNKLNTIT